MSNPFEKYFNFKNLPIKTETEIPRSSTGEEDRANSFEEDEGLPFHSHSIGEDEIQYDEKDIDYSLYERFGKRLQQEADEGALERDGKWTRKRYVMWAESFGEDEKWVDEHFEFQDDGTTITHGSIDLSRKGLTELPKGWAGVEGYCNLGANKLTSLTGVPESVGRSFFCDHNSLISLDELPENIGRNIWAENNPFTTEALARARAKWGDKLHV